MKKWITLCILPILSLSASAGVAPLRGLSFGTIAIADNTTVGSYTIDYFGNISVSPHFLLISAGEPAEFLLFDYPAGSRVHITPTVIAANTNSSPFSVEQFTLINLTSPGSVLIRSDGTASATIGGTLRTSGLGGNYTDANYTINIQVAFDF